MADNPLQLESTVHRSVPNEGFYEDVGVPLTAIRNAAGLVLTAATDPIVDVTNDVFSIEWQAADTDAVLLPLDLTGQFNPDNEKFRIVAQVGLIGSGTNADFEFNATIRVKPVGALTATAVAPSRAWVNGVELATPTDCVIPKGADIAGSVQVIWEFDLSAFEPNDAFTVKFLPNEAPGTNLACYLWSVAVRQRRHATLRDELARE